MLIQLLEIRVLAARAEIRESTLKMAEEVALERGRCGCIVVASLLLWVWHVGGAFVCQHQQLLRAVLVEMECGGAEQAKLAPGHGGHWAPVRRGGQKGVIGVCEGRGSERIGIVVGMCVCGMGERG